MTGAWIAALGAVLVGWPGWAIWRIGSRSSRGSPILAIPASFALGLSLLGAAGWSASLLRLGFRGAVATWYGILVLAAAITLLVAVRRVLCGAPAEPGGRRAIDPFELALAIIAGIVLALAAYTGPWLSATADSFYHLAAARSLATYGNALPEQIFFPAPDRYPDPTSGAWHLALALVADLSRADLIEVWRAANLATAGLTALAFGALALAITRSRAAAVLGTLLFLVLGMSLDFRGAAYPNQFGLLLAWLALAFAHRYAASGAPPELARAVLLGFGASAVHASAAPFLVVALGGGAALALLRPSPAARRLAVAALLTVAAALPIFAFQYLLISQPPIAAAAAATGPPPLRTIHLAGPFQLASPGFWLADFANATATLLLPAVAWLWWRRDVGAAAVLASLIAVPILVLLPPAGSSSSYQYALIRVGGVLVPMVYIAWAWALVLAVRLLREADLARRGGRTPHSRRPGREPRRVPRRLGWPAAAAIALSGLSIGAAAAAGPVRIYRPEPVVLKSVSASRSGDLTRTWADLLASIHRLPPGAVILSDPDTSYELAGLTGHPVVGLTASHTPIQDEYRDGPQRRGDSQDVIDGLLPPAEVAGILEQYGVGYVVEIGESAGGPGTPERTAVFPTVAAGSGWRLLRYDRSGLAGYLGLSSGILPTVVPAGRAAFVAAPGPADGRLSASDGSGHVFSSAVRGADPGAALVLWVPVGTPIGHYRVSFSTPGGAAVELGAIDVGRELQVENFAGVKSGVPANAETRGWVQLQGAAFHGRLAAATTALGAEAFQRLDPLPAADYCLEARVGSDGGPANQVEVTLGATRTDLTWAGPETGPRWLRAPVTTASSSDRLAVKAVARGQAEVVVDALAVYPAAACRPSA